jgi:hypothetical protein
MGRNGRAAARFGRRGVLLYVTDPAWPCTAGICAMQKFALQRMKGKIN